MIITGRIPRLLGVSLLAMLCAGLGNAQNPSAPTPLPTATHSPDANGASDLSDLSGVWRGRAAITQAGSCKWLAGPLEVTMAWTVGKDGHVAIAETWIEIAKPVASHYGLQNLRASWEGQISPDLTFFLIKTQAYNCPQRSSPSFTAGYRGKIMRLSSGPAIEMEAMEERCPPACIFRVAYSVSKKNQAQAPEVRASAMPAPTTPLPGAGGTAEIGSLKLDQADFRYPVYIGNLVHIISLNWFKPAQLVPRSPVVHFQIERDGTITDARIVTSSGLPSVDRAALRAVIVSSPVPPLPAEYGGAHLGIKVVFD